MGRLALVVFAEVTVNWQYLGNIKCLNLPCDGAPRLYGYYWTLLALTVAV